MAASDPDQRQHGHSGPPAPGSGQVLPRAVPLEPEPPPAVPVGKPISPQVPATATPRPVAAHPVAVTGEPTLAIHKREDLEQEVELSTIAVRNAPPWLISAIIHMVILIGLGLWLLDVLGEDNVVLEVDPDIYAEELGDQLEFDSPLGLDDVEEVQEPELAISDLPEVDDPFATPPDVEPYPDGMMSTSDLDSRIPGLSLDGREEGSKRSLLGKYGGNKTTEEAVWRGLAWLARNQTESGAWSLVGPYSGGVSSPYENRPAATAMALLAFQGAGVTHKSCPRNKYRKNVQDAWKWLLADQDADGCFFREGPRNHRFYTHGLCTIAVCELYGMTKDPKYKEPAERALQYCLKSQSPEGGWRYDPGGDSDVSVTGWLVLAMKSASMAGLEVPQDHFDRVTGFLDKVQLDGGSRYPYLPEQQAKRSMTAEALLMRQFLGWDRDDPRMVNGMKWITSERNLVDFDLGRDVYYWYYATQAAHNMEGDYWKRWNDVMRQVMCEQQIRAGRELGSWDPEKPTLDQWGPQGGRLFVTCLSIYMLEVYYRHGLPIYSKVYSRLRKSDRNPR